MYRELLKKGGFKVTRTREMVLDFLSKQKQPVSVQYILKRVGRGLDKVTIYRILGVLQRVGIVFEEYNGREALYYISEYQHHHIVCRNCGHTECLPCNHIFSGIKNFSDVSHRLTLSGLCNKCNK